MDVHCHGQPPNELLQLGNSLRSRLAWVETDEDCSRISLAFEEANRTSKPVAVLMGTEFGA